MRVYRIQRGKLKSYRDHANAKAVDRSTRVRVGVVETGDGETCDGADSLQSQAKGESGFHHGRLAVAETELDFERGQGTLKFQLPRCVKSEPQNYCISGVAGIC